MLSAVTICSTAIVPCANAAHPYGKETYDMRWSDGQEVDTILMPVTLKRSDNLQDVKVNVNITRYYDGTEVWDLVLPENTEFVLKKSSTDNDNTKIYKVDQIGSVGENGGASFIPNPELVDGIETCGIIDINEYGTFDIGFVLANNGKYKGDTVIIRAHKSLGKIIVKNNNSVDLDYSEDYDFINRLDANLDGSVDARDASTVLGIYADNSTNKPVNTMGEFYKVSGYTPNISGDAWNTSFGVLDCLKYKANEVDMDVHVSTPTGSKVLDGHIERYSDGSFDIELVNNDEELKLNEPLNSIYNKRYINATSCISIPDDYTMSFDCMEDIEASITSLPGTILKNEIDLTPGELVKFNGNIKAGNYSQFITFNVGSDATYLPVGTIAKIHIEPDKEFRDSTKQRMDAVDIFCELGCYEATSSDGSSLTISNYFGYDGFEKKDGIDVFDGIMQWYDYDYNADKDYINRLDANLDGSVDARDASTILCLYAHNSTHEYVDTLGKYNKAVKAEAAARKLAEEQAEENEPDEG